MVCFLAMWYAFSSCGMLFSKPQKTFNFVYLTFDLLIVYFTTIYRLAQVISPVFVVLYSYWFHMECFKCLILITEDMASLSVRLTGSIIPSTK